MSSRAPLIRPEDAPQGKDRRTKRELEALEQQQELDARSHAREHTRKEELRDLFALGVRWVLQLVFVLIGAALICLAWHYLAPPEWGWMPEDNMETITTALFSGTLFGFLGLYVRDRI